MYAFTDRLRMNIAQPGNIIEFKQGLKGIVQKVNQNSVIVDITIMKNFRQLDLEPLTVVNHKNYRILQEQM
jgi:uncharacterized protein YkvS